MERVNRFLIKLTVFDKKKKEPWYFMELCPFRYLESHLLIKGAVFILLRNLRTTWFLNSFSNADLFRLTLNLKFGKRFKVVFCTVEDVLFDEQAFKQASHIFFQVEMGFSVWERKKC